MSSNAIRWVAGFLVLLAVVLGIFGYKLSQRYAANAAAPEQQQTASPQSSVPQTLVVVATKPLALDKAIDRDAVALVPVQIAPVEYYTNVNDVVGKTPRLDIDSGAPITPRFFKKNNVLANQIPPGSVALSLKVDDVVGAGGFIQPGDIVDVLIYIRSISGTPTGEQGKDKTEDIATQARVLLKDTLVLSYEDRLVEAPKGLEEKDKAQQNQQRRERTAVIAVPEADVTRVMLGANVGDLRLALHRPEIQIAAAPASPVAPASTDSSTALPPGQAAVPTSTPPASATSSAASPAPTPAAAPATPAVASVSALAGTPVETASGTPPVLPLSDAEKAKIEAAKVPDRVITAAELGRIKAAPEFVNKKKKRAIASRPKIEILRGLSSEKTVYP